MNAIWLQHIHEYKMSAFSCETAINIIDLKIRRRELLLKKYGVSHFYKYQGNLNTIEQILLYSIANTIFN